MNNGTFIEKAFYGKTKKEHNNYSLKRDGHQNVYSYGIHYPLLFRVGDLTLLNDIGYSNSTSKHINLARGVDSDAISVKLYPEREGYGSGYTHIGRMLWYGEGESSPETVLDEIIGGMQHHLSDLYDKMDAKKRKNTQVYADLERQFDNIASAIAEMEA